LEEKKLLRVLTVLSLRAQDVRSNLLKGLLRHRASRSSSQRQRGELVIASRMRCPELAEGRSNLYKKILFLLLLSSIATNSYANDNYQQFAEQIKRQKQNTIAPYQQEIKNLVSRIKIKNDFSLPQKTIVANEEPTADPHIFIFVSFSMPPNSLKNLIYDAKTIGAGVYLRGLVDNSLPKTMTAFHQLLEAKTQAGIYLDPSLFSRFKIDKVPAIVVSDGDKFDVFYGDVKLQYALREILKTGEIQNIKIPQLLKKLNGETNVF
jgi:conjugal transfer pilus assembly protein TrbC